MENGLSSKSLDRDKGKVMKGVNGKRLDLDKDVKIEPFVPRRDHNPKDLRTWAKSTGFVSDYSEEAGTSASEKFDSVGFDDQRGEGGSSPKIEIDPVLGVAKPNRDNEIEQVSESKNAAIRGEKDRVFRSYDAWNGAVGNQNGKRKNGVVEHVLGLENNGEKKIGLRGNGDDVNGTVNLNRDRNDHEVGVGLGVSAVAPFPDQKKKEKGVTEDVKVNLYAELEEPADRGSQGPSGMKYGLTENPSLG